MERYMLKKYLLLATFFSINLSIVRIKSADAAHNDDNLVEQLELELARTQVTVGQHDDALLSFFNNIKAKTYEKTTELQSQFLKPIIEHMRSIPQMGGLNQDELKQYRAIICHLNAAAHTYNSPFRPEYQGIREQIKLAASSLYNGSSDDLKEFWHNDEIVSPLIKEIIGYQKKPHQYSFSSMIGEASGWLKSFLPQPLESYKMTEKDEAEMKRLAAFYEEARIKKEKEREKKY